MDGMFCSRSDISSDVHRTFGRGMAPRPPSPVSLATSRAVGDVPSITLDAPPEAEVVVSPAFDGALLVFLILLSKPFQNGATLTDDNASLVQPGTTVTNTAEELPGKLIFNKWSTLGGYAEVHEGSWVQPNGVTVRVAIKKLLPRHMDKLRGDETAKAARNLKAGCLPYALRLNF